MASSSTFTLTFRGPQVTAAAQQSALRGVQRALAIFDREWVRLVLQTQKSGRTYTRGGVRHQASAPGQPFASDTGRTLNSRKTTLDASTLTGTWRVTSNYAHMLEFGTRHMAARPTARPAYAAKRKEMEAAIERELQRGLA